MISRREFLSGLLAAIAGGFTGQALTPDQAADLDHLSREGRDEFERTGVVPQATPSREAFERWADHEAHLQVHREAWARHLSFRVWRS